MKADRRETPPRPMTSRGAATRARIIEAAAQLVSVRGAAGTSLDDIMAASRTSKSQLYHYFADKDALLCAVVVAQADRVIASQESCLQEAGTLAGLRRWRDKIIHASRANGGIGGCPVGSLASELADRSEQAREILAGSFRIWQAHLAASLEVMRSRGELRPGSDPHDLAMAIVAALQGGLLLAQTTRTVRPLELALDMALDHVSRHEADS